MGGLQTPAPRRRSPALLTACLLSPETGQETHRRRCCAHDGWRLAARWGGNPLHAAARYGPAGRSALSRNSPAADRSRKPVPAARRGAEAGWSPSGQFLASLAWRFGRTSPMAGTRRGLSAAQRMMSRPSQQTVDITIQKRAERTGVDWNAIGAERRAQMAPSDVQNAMMRGEDLSPDAIGRLASFRQLRGVTPTRGADHARSGRITREEPAKIGANTIPTRVAATSSLKTRTTRVDPELHRCRAADRPPTLARAAHPAGL